MQILEIETKAKLMEPDVASSLNLSRLVEVVDRELHAEENRNMFIEKVVVEDNVVTITGYAIGDELDRNRLEQAVVKVLERKIKCYVVDGYVRDITPLELKSNEIKNRELKKLLECIRLEDIELKNSILGRSLKFRKALEQCYNYNLTDSFIDSVDQLYNQDNEIDIIVFKYADRLKLQKELEVLANSLISNRYIAVPRIDCYDESLLDTDWQNINKAVELSEHCCLGIDVSGDGDIDDLKKLIRHISEYKNPKLLVLVHEDDMYNNIVEITDSNCLNTIRINDEANGNDYFDDSDDKSFGNESLGEGVNEVMQNVFKDIVGLDGVKKQIQGYVNIANVNCWRKKFGLPVLEIAKHLTFVGPPGVAKSTVASLLAPLLFRIRAIQKNEFKTYTRSDLIGDCIGATAIKTRNAISACGGVVLIDEAYGLFRAESRNDYGHECIEELLVLMTNENCPVIVFAGYVQEMEELLESNPGLKSRVQVISFESYSSDELLQIFDNTISKYDLNYDERLRSELKVFFELARSETNFANGRFVMNYLSTVLKNYAERLSGNNDVRLEDLKQITDSDLNLSAEKAKVLKNIKQDKYKIKVY